MSQDQIFTGDCSVDNQILENISSILLCDKSDVCNIYHLDDGLTNHSWHFATSDGEYVYRRAGLGTENMIDRHAENDAEVLAHKIGLDDTFIHINPEQGWKISRFLQNCTTLEVHDDVQLADAMKMARQLHALEERLDRSFEFWDEYKRYEQLLPEEKPDDYYMLYSDAQKLMKFVQGDNAPVCITHNDFFSSNILRDTEGKLYLIDWEYAGTGDYANDYGTFVVASILSDEEAERALEFYFDRTPTLEEKRHNYGAIALAGWCWYLWALAKEAEGDDVGEWTDTYLSYAKRYIHKALALYEQ